jgi:hypothetical protein
MVFEMPATGGVVPTYILRPVKLIRYVTTFDFIIFVCEILFCCFILYYIVEEAIEIKKHKFQYFTVMWNILDIVIIIFAIMCVIFNVYRKLQVDNLLTDLLYNEDKFVDFNFLCYWETQFNTVIAIMTFFAWIKVINCFCVYKIE